MKHQTFLILLSAVCPRSTVSSGGSLTAITDQMPFVGQLYLRLGSESNGGLNNIGVWLASNELPETRKRVCQDVMSNDYFAARGLYPLRVDDYFYYEGRGGGFSQFEHIYRRVKETDPYPRYVNPYLDLVIQFPAVVNVLVPRYTVISRHEQLFVCPVKARHSDEIQFYWISKEYNVANEVSMMNYKAGRFVFRDSGKFLAMAEEPAVPLLSPDFNLELEYVRRKRIFRTETFSANDPLCALVREDSVENEHDRLCMTVLGSSYFEGQFRLHPRQLNQVGGCSRNLISFQTEEARGEADFGDGVYNEWMIRCPVKEARSNRPLLYMISRAYDTREVFVYTYDLTNGGTYLENLSVDVNITDNPHGDLWNISQLDVTELDTKDSI